MEALLYSEINILCVVLMLVIAVKMIASGFCKSQNERAFVGSVLFAAAANVFDFLWNMGLSGYWRLPPSVMKAVDFCYFIVFGLSAYCWYVYTETHFDKNAWTDKRKKAICALPLAILAVLLTVSLFNGCLFGFDEAGVYYRGPLFYAQQILSFALFILSSVKCFVRAFQKKHLSRREEFLVMAAFVVPPVICSVFQIVFQTIPILSVGIVISFQLACINFLERKISQDSLTGISNRREILRLTGEKMRLKKENENLWFLFIDVDNFKYINDTFGHGKGDRILTELSEGLVEYAKGFSGFCGRYGGDEFAMVFCAEKDVEKSKIQEGLERHIAEQNIFINGEKRAEISVGCAKLDGSDGSVSDLVSRADSDMYSVKHTKKKREKKMQ